MPSPDPSNEFSHLPTVDETGRADDGDAPAVWQRHRRGPGPGAETGAQPAAHPPAATPESTPPVDKEAWQSLLEMEVDDAPLMEHQRRPAAAPRTPVQPGTEAPKPRTKTVIRAPGKRAEAPLGPGVSVPADEAPTPPPKAPAKEPVKEAAREEPPSQTPAKKEGEEPEDPTAEAGSAKEAPKAEVKIETEPVPKSPWRHRWEKIGGQALGLSVAIHLFLLGGAAVYVVGKAMETQVDFLPGGGSAQSQAAADALQHKIQQKKNPWVKKMPMRRLAALDKSAEFALPDAPDSFELPDAANSLLKGKFGAGMGLAGAGGGFGKGMGLGGKSGMVFQPFTMFGRQINARKLALVLDVSMSMAPHLPRVIEEVDKVAKDSVVVLFVGCGLEAPPPKGLDGEEIYRTSGQEFEKFWRLQGATLEESRKFKINPKDPIPMEDVFRLLSRRPQTYFVHAVGLSYTWVALLSNEVRSADALYWFSDFQDVVNFRQLSIVRENLLNRKQKLYIHAYQRGSAFDLVVSQLVQPTNGDVIEANP